MNDWIDIKDYEGLYKINKRGEIMRDGKILKNQLDNRGYYYVSLCKNGIRKNFTIHRLLALYYIPNPNNLEQVDHVDRKRTNNNIENLRWVSSSQNNCNRNKHSNNTSGYIGVCRTTRRNKIYWEAKIMKNGITTRKLFEFTDEGLISANDWYVSNKELLHVFD